MVREVYLWPENLEAWQHWQAVRTQWRVGVGGATGLDYAGVRAYLDEMQPQDRAFVFRAICACEREVLDVWAQQRERDEQARQG